MLSSNPAPSPAGAALIGYARCSTDKQDLAAQVATLEGLGVAPERVYTAAQGEKAKSDCVDTRVLAEFGAGMTPAPTLDPGQGTRHLKA